MMSYDLFAAATVHLPFMLWAVRVGSRVYGTADAESDHDYVAVLCSGTGYKDSDLIRYASGGEHLDIMVRTQEAFQSSLDNQNVFAIECLWTPAEHILQGSDVLSGLRARWRLNPSLLRQQATEKSNSDYGHYLKTCGDRDRRTRKHLWHSLRVPMFAAQVLQYGRITDYTSPGEVCSLYDDIMTDPVLDPTHWGQIRQDLLSKIYC